MFLLTSGIWLAVIGYMVTDTARQIALGCGAVCIMTALILGVFRD